GEGEREDLLGARLALRDEMGDAPRDDGGLAGAGAGDDQEGSRLVGDGGALIVVQAIEDAPAYHLVRLYRRPLRGLHENRPVDALSARGGWRCAPPPTPTRRRRGALARRGR